ncbi:hypothetical protein [Enterococcus faecalis]|uniref:hypothetical protein n=1 Tax=Enterococcus faecalis TaxID=1351 RepID=UPI0032E03D89
MIYSKWIDNSNISLEDLIKNIKENEQNHVREIDAFDNTPLNYEVDFVYDENQLIIINDKNIYYNYLQFNYEYVKNHEAVNPNREKRVSTYAINVIVFNYENKNYYICNKSYANSTLVNLRKLVGYKKDLMIKGQRVSGIKTDLFIWMIHHLIDNPNEFLEEYSKTKLLTLTGFKGQRKDRLAEISGSGEQILNMLTTLLFLFENKEISKVQVQITRYQENFSLTLGENSFIDIDINEYRGTEYFEMPETIEAIAVLKCFIDVIPSLIIMFSNELDSKKWTPRKENKFFKDIGRTLSREINKSLRNK